MSQNKNIVATWTKIQASCNEKYPDKLEFFNNGLYRGSIGNNDNEFTIWDAGNYEIISDSKIKISTANDEVIMYSYLINDNILNFVDREGCEIRYKKMES